MRHTVSRVLISMSGSGWFSVVIEHGEEVVVSLTTELEYEGKPISNSALLRKLVPENVVVNSTVVVIFTRCPLGCLQRAEFFREQ
jgi:hypothetical protein